ncbi:MAG: rhomboid family intramembrane serine protease [Chloroflexi bacterium]|nr:rhomboid family intramembrane serine protease [Chloroflexota bacterium]
MELNNNTPNSNNPPHPADHQRVRITLPTVQPILTYAILSIIAAIFLYGNSLSRLQSQLFMLDWAKVNDRILYHGEYYRLFTCMFLHLDLMHIFFNGYALYIFGRDVESLFGHVRFALIYVLGGITASLASLLYTNAVSIGASGAIFAIFSAMGVYLYRHRHLYGEGAQRRLSQMGVLALINIGFGLLPDSNIDNAAHIGGLVGGFILAWFICPEFEVQRDLIQPGGVRIVDVNTPNKWMYVPILFAAGLVASVAYAVSVLA